MPEQEHPEQGDVFAERRDKLDAWRETGAAYPTAFQPREEIGPLRAAFEHLEAGQEAPGAHRVAGRVMARARARQGVVRGAQGRQRRAAAVRARSTRWATSVTRPSSDLDLGDFVGAEGTVMRTRRGELSLRLTAWTLLSQVAAPAAGEVPRPHRHGDPLPPALPRPHRQRRGRARCSSSARASSPPCAASWTRAASSRSRRRCCSRSPAAPWRGPSSRTTTSCDRDLYLRIATELYLKRCIIGGFDRVYEIGKDFRNEGVALQAQPRVHDARDLQAYVDYNDVMAMVEEMIGAAAQSVGRPQIAVPRPRGGLHAALAARRPCARPSAGPGIDIGADARARSPTCRRASPRRACRARCAGADWGSAGGRAFGKLRRARRSSSPMFITEHPLET